MQNRCRCFPQGQNFRKAYRAQARREDRHLVEKTTDVAEKSLGDGKPCNDFDLSIVILDSVFAYEEYVCRSPDEMMCFMVKLNRDIHRQTLERALAGIATDCPCE
jgi:hypothetical protein